MAPENKGSIRYINFRDPSGIIKGSLPPGMMEFWKAAYGEHEAERRKSVIEATDLKSKAKE